VHGCIGAIDGMIVAKNEAVPQTAACASYTAVIFLI
jgi:hypothetical protein